jgi:hypothetical protein
VAVVAVAAAKKVAAVAAVIDSAASGQAIFLHRYEKSIYAYWEAPGAYMLFLFIYCYH